MLPKRQRLSKRIIEEYLQKKGKRVKSPHFSVLYLKNKDTVDFSVGVSVSKKVSKSAVVRNTVRRRCYEAIRYVKVSVPKGTIALFSYVSKDIKTPLNELKEEMERVFRSL